MRHLANHRCIGDYPTDGWIADLYQGQQHTHTIRSFHRDGLHTIHIESCATGESIEFAADPNTYWDRTTIHQIIDESTLP